MESGRRVQRLEKELRLAIGQYLLTGFKHELPGLVTIQRVIATKDLRTAKIFVSVMNELGAVSNQQDLIVNTIQEHVAEVQAHLAHTLKLRYTPKLTFLADHSSERVMEVERVLRQISTPGDKSAEDSE